MTRMLDLTTPGAEHEVVPAYVWRGEYAAALALEGSECAASQAAKAASDALDVIGRE